MQFFLAKYDKQKMMDTAAVIIGILAACFFCLAYFVIGTDSYVEFHDQLDGEVLNYIYQAKYLCSSEDIIPEFMNGMSKSAMMPPAPIGVLFYLLLPPFYAFAFMHLFVLIVGYLGFYLLLKKLTQNPIISILISCLFIYLPFYSVYGLSILGQPLLVWALWQIYDSKKVKLRYLICVLLYTISSSLVLVGYVWVGMLLLFSVILGFQKKEYKGLMVAWVTMVVTYVVANINLIKNIFSSDGVSNAIHREEMVIYAITDGFGYFKEIFLEGISYAYSYNVLITILAVMIISLYPIAKKWLGIKKWSGYYWGIVILFSVNLIISLLATVWHMEPIVSLRNNCEGFIKTFQLDRITWILPLCWYTIFALCIALLIQEIKPKIIGCICALVMVFAVGCIVCKHSLIVPNLKLILFPDTYRLTDWDDWYATDVYQQIDDFIGEEKSSYRVVSLGLPPATALYNGFYCLDGYSNFYALEYKHQFRQIISKELDKLEEVRLYFDEWGNRCYLFNAETGNYMTIDKNNNGTYKNLEFDTEQLKSMGAKYIFAGMPIENAKDLGLKLAREEAFSTDSSYFRVWLYEICR